MKKNKSPAFQFYPTDHLSDENVQMMTLEEEGAYLRALCYCWNEGSIPSSPAALAKLIGKGASTTLTTVVQACFTPCKKDSSRMTHARLEKERRKQTEWRRKSSEGGKKSAEKRAEIAKKSIRSTSKGGSTGPVQPNVNSSSSSISSSISPPILSSLVSPQKLQLTKDSSRGDIRGDVMKIKKWEPT